MWWLIITIIVCTCIIVKVIKDQSPEGQNKKIARAIEPLEKQIGFWGEQIMHKEPESIDGEILDRLREDFVKMEKNYDHLKEKEKDLKKLLEFATDLQEYSETLFHLKMAWCIFQTDMSDDAVDKYYGEKNAGLKAKKEEIEKKFDRLLK